jgi:PleD family two-component response regulator
VSHTGGLSHINVAVRKLCILRKSGAGYEVSVPPMVAPPRNSMAGAPVVVIVDDDPAVCGSLKFSLELEGFVVHAYGNAGEFLAADESACDCLVIDQRMPGMSGS